MLGRGTLLCVALLGLVVLPLGCRSIVPLAQVRAVERDLVITAYCPCGECCGWRRRWLFWPVCSSGPHRGERKRVGVTSTGARARVGTISADPKVFPYGTVLYVEGYGYGRVEDTGGGIKGKHIELFFRRHAAALQWGRQRRRVRVWFPAGRPPGAAARSKLDPPPRANAALEVVLNAAHVGHEVGPRD